MGWELGLKEEVDLIGLPAFFCFEYMMEEELFWDEGRDHAYINWGLV